MAKQKSRFAQFVADTRVARGYTQEKFAELCGKSPGWSGQIETDKIDIPPPDTVRTMARVLEIPVSDLLVALGYLDEPCQDLTSQLQRIAALGSPEARLQGFDALPQPLRVAMLRLMEDTVLGRLQQRAG